MLQIELLEDVKSKYESKELLEERANEMKLKNKLESEDNLKAYFRNEIAKREQVIEQQRSIIRALSRKSIEEIKNPLL